MTDIKKLIELNKEEVIDTLVKLLQIPSVLDETTITKEHPFGKSINDALEFMLNKASNDGFETLNDEGYAGHITYGNENGKLIAALCHLDVVPEGKGWHYPPYEAQIVDNKIYARGSTDDKGPTIAAYYALKFIKDCNIKLKNQIRIIFGTDEETGWRGVKHYFEKYPMPDMGFAPDCNFPLVYGEKGRITFDLASASNTNDDVLVSITGGTRYNVVLDEVEAVITKDLTEEFNIYLESNKLTGSITSVDEGFLLKVKGVAAHAMEPQIGRNAGTYLCDFLKDYSNNPLVAFVAKYLHLGYYLDKIGADYDDYEMGKITCNIGIMNITNDSSRVTLDIRYPVRYDTNRLFKIMNDLTAENNVKVTDSSIKEPHYVSPNDDLVKLLYEAYVKNTNDHVNKPFTVGGGTYASMLTNGVAYGMMLPGEPELAHQVDENLNIDTLMKGIAIYIDAFLALGEIDA